MYAHFYQLSENPFNLTPDPKFHYVNDSTREALASLLHGIKSRKGFITLIAEAGTGKTTLLKRIVEEIEGETQIVFVFNPGVSFDELLEFMCTELGIETRGCKRLHLLERLNHHLLEQLTAGRNVVVMIDEAQTLEDSVLEELRMLSNLETSKEKILQILLSGQPELEEKLRRPSLRQLRQRIGVRATLKPVQPSEMQAYVETRLRGAGAERADLFTPAALKRIWQASGGIPRVINVICDNAMMIAFAEGQKRITPKTLNEAVRDLEGDGSRFEMGSRLRDWLTSRSVGYALAAAAVVLAAIPFASVVRRGLEASPHAAAAPTAPRSDALVTESVNTPPASSGARPTGAPALAPDLPAAADTLEAPSSHRGFDSPRRGHRSVDGCSALWDRQRRRGGGEGQARPDRCGARRGRAQSWADWLR
jgi:general secretion pathway protein A